MSPQTTILIVDDRPENLLSLRAMLEDLDINIISASSGNEALALLLEHECALVLLDVQMPEMNGFEVAELMQANTKTSTIPIIFITAISKDQEHIFKGYAAGAVDYIFKPLDQAQILVSKVKVFCELYEAREKIKQAVDTQRLSEQQWQLTFEAISDLVTIHDTKFHLLRVNRATAEFFGKEPEELVGRKCYDVFCGQNSKCTSCPIISLEQDLRPHTAEINHSVLKKTFQVSVSPIFDEAEQFIGVVHIAKDISARKKLETQLHQAQKMEAIGTLAGGIAHDFNNILTPIVGYAALLRRDAKPGSPLHKGLGIIEQAAGRATELVKQILSFSRQHEHEMISIAIQPIIKEALKLLRSSLPATIEIRQDIDMECGAIMADSTQIHQLLMNLCTNSGHAMAEHGGVLEISLRCQELLAKDCVQWPDLSSGQYLLLEVSDSGCGMAADLLDRIFEPYFTTKEKDQGTGMGLAVVHSIVTAQQGQISVTSEIGQGTTFHILLPVVGKPGGRHKKEKSDTVLPSGNEHVLLVDDEEYVVMVYGEILLSLGYQVSTETSSQKALDLFLAGKDDFDIVITDLTMPEMTGIELAHEIIAIRPEIPIILCTGISELIDAEQAQDIGLRAYLHKPVSIQDMGQVVRRVLDGEKLPEIL